MASTEATVSLQFLEPLELYKREKPFRLSIGVDKAASTQNTSVESEENSVTTSNIRATRTNFKPEYQCFRPLTHKLDCNQWRDKDQVKTSCLKDVETPLLDSIQGSYRVFIFDWRVLNPDFERLVFLPITVTTDQKRGHRKGDRWHRKDAITFERYGQQLYIAALGLHTYRYQNLRRLWLQTLIFCRLNITSSSLMLRVRRHPKEEADQLSEAHAHMVKSELKSKSP